MVLKQNNTQKYRNSLKYTCCSMKRAYLVKESKNSHVALSFPGRVWDNISPIQRTKAKEVKNGFLGQSYDTSQGPQWTNPFSKGDDYFIVSQFRKFLLLWCVWLLMEMILWLSLLLWLILIFSWIIRMVVVFIHITLWQVKDLYVHQERHPPNKDCLWQGYLWILMFYCVAQNHPAILKNNFSGTKSLVALISFVEDVIPSVALISCCNALQIFASTLHCIKVLLTEYIASKCIFKI